MAPTRPRTWLSYYQHFALLTCPAGTYSSRSSVSRKARRRLQSAKRTREHSPKVCHLRTGAGCGYGGLHKFLCSVLVMFHSFMILSPERKCCLSIMHFCCVRNTSRDSRCNCIAVKPGYHEPTHEPSRSAIDESSILPPCLYPLDNPRNIAF